MTPAPQDAPADTDGSNRNDLGYDAPNGTGPADDDSSSGAFSLVTKALIGVVVLSSFAIWVYAFSGAARRDAPDLLGYRDFPLAAESICAAALADIDAMPGALEAVDGPDRGRQVRATTARFESMLDELDPIVGGTERDLEISRGWLADWRVLIQDRYRYADAISDDVNSQFLITDTGVGERLDRRITRLANTNAMTSCAAPGDVG